MKKSGNSFDVSATDLVGYLNCRHLSFLERAVADGTLRYPHIRQDPLLDALSARGTAHELSYIQYLAGEGLDVTRIAGFEVTSSAIAETLAAMQLGVPIIVQAALSEGNWVGRADILRRVETASSLGGWSYEPIDTKLARETKAGAILQLCLYADLLGEMQGRPPEAMYVVAPWSDFWPQQFRFADYAAYFRKVKRALSVSLAQSSVDDSYPDPIDHCDICRWREGCDKHRRDDDHLCLVAGISKIQINELQENGIETVEILSRMPLPLRWRPNRGSADAYTRIREQARIVVQARQVGKGLYEVLPVEQGFGLTRLPEPSQGDIFLDFESDPFVGEHGLEYLFGYLYRDRLGTPLYDATWAFSRIEEKQAFEQFVDFVMRRRTDFPSLHVYHYAPYEPAALKRLMGRYATRQEEIDILLRAKVFVDLYQIVRHGIRASVESYSIKRLEPFFGYERKAALTDANSALAILAAGLELDDIPSIPETVKSTVRDYNEDDCRSASELRDWLEALRAGLIADGADVPRPLPGDEAPSEDLTDWQRRVNELIERLTQGVPVDSAQRSGEQQARWILANVLDWHRREEKAVWWEYFRLSDLSAEELLEERPGLADLVYIDSVGGTEKAPVHRYRFAPQETEIRGGEDVRFAGGANLGKVEAIEFGTNTIDIKKRQDTAGTHPTALFAHTYVRTKVMAESLLRLGEYVAENGLLGDGPYQSARDLLLRESPKVDGQPLQLWNEGTVAAAVRLCCHLAAGILPIQGPPGAGKTYTAARMICELVRQGKRVGITANSHAVIRHLINGTIKAADEQNIELQCCQKAEELAAPQHRLSFAKDNKGLLSQLRSGTSVAGGTAWLWSSAEAYAAVDVLFVDEAAQMSLANVLAVSQAAKTLVLVGDPQQLNQPMKGSHPEGTDVSALDHILMGQRTIAQDNGLFLEETWRLHPAICAYTSELFYDGKLHSRAGLECQVIKGGPLNGSGLYFLPVTHRGNQNCSPEEAKAVALLVRAVLDSKATWVNRDGQESLVTFDDIIIVAPYNAQVFEIKQSLPEARVGTVDKFQGQEAAIAIYSTATSSYADAPRGMEFLYNLNRLNVATSRAKCASVLVASPQIFEAECRTPRQIRLANAFCRYLEMSQRLDGVDLPAFFGPVTT